MTRPKGTTTESERSNPAPPRLSCTEQLPNQPVPDNPLLREGRLPASLLRSWLQQARVRTENSDSRQPTARSSRDEPSHPHGPHQYNASRGWMNGRRDMTQPASIHQYNIDNSRSEHHLHLHQYIKPGRDRQVTGNHSDWSNK